MESVQNIYKIKYSTIPYGSDIVVYGAGRVGESYVKSIQKTGRLNIRAVVDGGKAGGRCEGLPVREPEALSDLSYDYILIAMENPRSAREVRQYLLSVGAADEAIVWNGNKDPELLRSGQEYEKFLERNLQGTKKRLFLFMVPEHGNVGDYAIAYAELDFVRQYFPQYEVTTVTTLEWMNAKDAVIGFVGQSDLIFLNGGGYLGDLWEGDIENYRSIVECFPKHKIVFFPNTLSFRDGLADNEAFAREMQWFAGQKNVFVMLRDALSFTSFRKYNSSCMLAPDMALFAGTKGRRRRTENGRKNEVLLCLRHDREKLGDGGERIMDGLESGGIGYCELEINAQRYISFADGKRYVEKICAEMAKRECVITDRLHGMILAALSNVPCVALDNKTHKVRGVFEWIKEKGYVVYYDDDSGVDICGAVELAIARKEAAGEFIFSAAEFDKMARAVQAFIQ